MPESYVIHIIGTKIKIINKFISVYFIQVSISSRKVLRTIPRQHMRHTIFKNFLGIARSTLREDIRNMFCELVFSIINMPPIVFKYRNSTLKKLFHIFSQQRKILQLLLIIFIIYTFKFTNY